MAKKRSKREKEADEELIRKGKDAVKDFDASKGFWVAPPKRDNRLISIRLPNEMIDRLREAAIRKGAIGYQQVIKLYISEGLLKDKQAFSGDSKNEAA